MLRAIGTEGLFPIHFKKTLSSFGSDCENTIEGKNAQKCAH